MCHIIIYGAGVTVVHEFCVYFSSAAASIRHHVVALLYFQIHYDIFLLVLVGILYNVHTHWSSFSDLSLKRLLAMRL